MSREKLRAGDRVVVRSPAEILSTLDAEGTLDGLPFMPEMVDWCGKSFSVLRRVEKTCVEADRPIYPNRRFANDDVVMLQGPRCDGQGHDGCQRGCRIFWKESWLRHADSDGRWPPLVDSGPTELRARLKVRADENRYFCQSTELHKATVAFPGKKLPWMIRIAFKEVRNGDLPVLGIAKRFALWYWHRLRRATTGDPFERGPNDRTPTATLDLKPGEIVRIKSRDQIVETLGRNGRNRGMGICYEMSRCCNGEAEVRMQVDRIIEEKSGRMRELTNTVMLRNLRGNPTLCEECLCYNEIGDCPRGELMYWREIWLERVRATGA